MSELEKLRRENAYLKKLLGRVNAVTQQYYQPKKTRGKPCPYDDIELLYKQILVVKGMADIRDLTDERKRKIRVLWQKHLTTLDDWENYFIDASEKPFLFGQNARHWRADFDFMIRESTPIKMQEGKYD